MVEAKTASKWVNDDKVSGDDVKFSKLKKHQECLEASKYHAGAKCVLV